MDLLNMGNLSDFQTHIQTAYQARQRLQNLQREGTLDVDGATLDISAIVAVA